MQGSEKNRMLLICLIAVLVVIFVLAGTIFARYYMELIKDSAIESEDFILLVKSDNDAYYEDGLTYQAIGGNTFSFKVSNNEAGVISPSDISITILVKQGETEVLSYTGTLTGGIQSDYEASFIPEQDKSYTVSVESSAPYEKSISFTVEARAKTLVNYYDLKDYGTYVQADIYIGTTPPGEGELAIKYGVLSPDNSNILMADWLANETGRKITVEEYCHYTLIFYKNGASVTVTDVNEKVINGIVLTVVP